MCKIESPKDPIFVQIGIRARVTRGHITTLLKTNKAVAQEYQRRSRISHSLRIIGKSFQSSHLDYMQLIIRIKVGQI